MHLTHTVWHMIVPSARPGTVTTAHPGIPPTSLETLDSSELHHYSCAHLYLHPHPVSGKPNQSHGCRHGHHHPLPGSLYGVPNWSPWPSFLLPPESLLHTSSRAHLLKYEIRSRFPRLKAPRHSLHPEKPKWQHMWPYFFSGLTSNYSPSCHLTIPKATRCISTSRYPGTYFPPIPMGSLASIPGSAQGISFPKAFSNCPSHSPYSSSLLYFAP